VIGEPTLADAILDRIVHRGHMNEMTGESMRKQKNLKQREHLK
jgi:DNA replication protein DnaC